LLTWICNIPKISKERKWISIFPNFGTNKNFSWIKFDT
jgi:hypothetical protein